MSAPHCQDLTYFLTKKKSKLVPLLAEMCMFMLFKSSTLPIAIGCPLSVIVIVLPPTVAVYTTSLTLVIVTVPSASVSSVTPPNRK
jgi:hypothetical protein